MSNPTKSKDLKPKADHDDLEIKQAVKTENSSGVSIIPIIIVVVIATIVMLATNFILIDMKMHQLSSQINNIAINSDNNSADSDSDTDNTLERGIILDLGEFILNLSDTSSRKFLKVNVAVELSKKESDNVEPKKSGGHGHGGGNENPMAHIEAEMNQYKPAIRDSIISVLSSKTSDELSTTPGKELAKEQIKESVDAIFDSNREVLRVSFGSFFIQ